MLYSGGEIPGVNQKFKTLTLSVQISDLIGLVIKYITPPVDNKQRKEIRHVNCWFAFSFGD